MKQDICSIPLSEIFEKKNGCPFCGMAAMLERRLTDYILGPAMMEVDVRAETNRLGFCARHASLLCAQEGRLSLALMLQSRLGALADGYPRGAEKPGCFLCENVGLQMARLTDEFFVLWKGHAEFRTLAAAQPFYCMPHAATLLERSRGALGRRGAADFERALSSQQRQSLRGALADIDVFCNSFDYRSAGKTEVRKDAIERAARILSGEFNPNAKR